MNQSFRKSELSASVIQPSSKANLAKLANLIEKYLYSAKFSSTKV